jgi:hypothetical protein
MDMGPASNATRIVSISISASTKCQIGPEYIQPMNEDNVPETKPMMAGKTVANGSTILHDLLSKKAARNTAVQNHRSETTVAS